MTFQAKHFLLILLGREEEALYCTPFMTTFLCFTLAVLILLCSETLIFLYPKGALRSTDECEPQDT